MNNLFKKIDVVLAEEVRSYQANGRIRGGLGSFNQTLSDGWTMDGQIPQLIGDTSSQDIIRSPNSDLLLKLHSSLNSQDKSSMGSYLIRHLRKDSEFTDAAYLVIFALFRIGRLIDGLNMARRSLKGDTNHSYSNLLGMLAKIVRWEYSFIAQDTYDRIKLVLQGDDEYNFQLLEKINSAELKILESQLDDVNPEINQDRDKVISVWDQRFPGSAISKLINEIEEHFKNAEFDQNRFATCIGRIRVLIVEVTKAIAQEISGRAGDRKIKSSTDEHAVFDYLESKKFIDKDEWNMLRSLYSLASDAGSHALSSKREYARLIKNMTYEMVLLLLSKTSLITLDPKLKAPNSRLVEK